ncbi:PREDICTED: probable cytochrome P450 304a1 isoform X2 [Dinoponera quadriceps]|uniref:Probable cytochrome P450 304a1 isoform X2 n=1 Tax=Dinoponera quadriceps TaxID=609295 RepID=A0A6P3XQ05_DINQU|nr:PREDICTED: probable cytochrome P450 304a1 isoform X2 [Dinoponera quadriceps]
MWILYGFPSGFFQQGVFRIPISGSYLTLLLRNYSFPYNTVEYYAKKLKTKIIGYYLGSFWVVVANDYANIKEILKRGEFNARVTEVPIIKDRSFGKMLGITFTDGPLWREQRRFFLRNVRDFGFGRRQEAFEREILDEVSLLINILKHGPIYDGEKEIIKGNLALFPDILYSTIGSSLWKVLFGQRFDRTEHDIPRRVCRLSMMFVRSLESTGGAIFHLPFLKFFGNMFGYKNVIKSNYLVADIIQEYLKSLETTFGENVDRGFVDRYLNVLNKNDKSQYFSEKQVIMMLTDVMLATCSTIPATVTQIIKFLINHPMVLKKAQDEIDKVVGTGRLVTWDDRKNLPYTEAVIRETMRINSLLPLGIFHRAVKDTTLGEYTISANTPVVTNLAAMHHDPDLWGDPENFRPERFINENNELSKDMSLPFGLGHRVCPGETYSRYNMFGMIAALLQTFNFYLVEGEPSRIKDNLSGLIITPKEFWVRYELR